VEFTASSTEIHIVTREQEGGDLGKGSVILDEGLSEGRAVVGDKDELGLTVSGGLEGALGTEGDLTRSDDEGQLGVDVFLSSFLDHFY